MNRLGENTPVYDANVQMTLSHFTFERQEKSRIPAIIAAFVVLLPQRWSSGRLTRLACVAVQK